MFRLPEGPDKRAAALLMESVPQSGSLVGIEARHLGPGDRSDAL